MVGIQLRSIFSAPDTTFIQSSLFSAFFSKVTVLQFLTVLVTLVSIIFLSSVTSVIASLPLQIGEEDFRLLKKIYSFLCHSIIYSQPISSTLFLHKTAGGPFSVVAVKQLSNLPKSILKI